jgi:hypothetical protein
MDLPAELRLKEEALPKVPPWDVPPGRFRPDDELLAFLEGLGLCRIKQRSARTIRRILGHPANPSRHNPEVGIMKRVVSGGPAHGLGSPKAVPALRIQSR